MTKPRTASAVGLSSIMLLTSMGLTAPSASALDDVPAPSALYTMEFEGTQLTDVSGNNYHGTLVNFDATDFIDVEEASVLTFDGQGYVSLPSGPITAADNDFTVEMTLAAPATQNQFAWVIGDGIGQWNTTQLGNHIFVNPSAPDFSGELFGGIRVKTDGNHGETRIPKGGNLLSGEFSTLTLTSKDQKLTIFVNGEERTSLTHSRSLTDIIPSGNVLGYLGRSLYQPDGLFKGKVSSVALWDEALTAQQVAQRVPTETERRSLFSAVLQGNILTTLLGTNVSADAVTERLNLTGILDGVALTWTSSNEDIVALDGTVTRSPDVDAHVVLTATDAQGNEYEFELVIKKISSEDIETFVREDLAALNIEHITNENLPLIAQGANGSAITWTSSNPELVSETVATQTAAVGATDPFSGAGIVTRPTYGSGDAEVTITAEVSYGAVSETKSFDVTVKELARTAPDTGYVAAYFKADNNERIYQAHTQGNNFFTFTESNGGAATITSTTDEKGLRDPYILRSVNGDRYYLVATDLCIGCGKGWGNAQQWGSLKIHVYESTDLVNWTPTNGTTPGITVNQPLAGMTWAPEVYWDDDLESYVVFFASRMYEDSAHTVTDNRAQMFYVLTRDFKTFTYPPTVWQNTGHSRIDSTVIKIDDYYYRFTKNEGGGTADGLERGNDVFLEKSKVLTAQTFGSNPTADPETTWQLLDTAMTGPITNQAGEGPQIVKLNEGDPNNTQDNDGYVFLVDNYGSGGYVPFLTTGKDISESSWENRLSQRTDWTALPKTGLPSSPRHGAFVNVPQTVLDAVSSWSALEAVNSTITAQLNDRTITANVTAADHGDVAGTVTFSAGAWTQTVTLTNSTAQVDVPAEITGNVTVKYDGYRDNAVNTSTRTISLDAETPGGEDEETGLPQAVVHYTFDSSTVNGTTVQNTASENYNATIVGNGATVTDGKLVLPGGSSSSNAASVSVPRAAFDNQETVTISMWLANQTGNGNYAAAYIGGTSPNNGYWLFNPASPSGVVKSVITSATAATPSSSPWSTETGSTSASYASVSGMTHYTTVIDGAEGKFSVYVNGLLISQNDISTDLTSFGTLRADIGRSAYSDIFFKGQVDDYAVYHSALDVQQVRELYTQGGGDFDEVIESIAQTIDVPQEVSTDFYLPQRKNGISIQWAVTTGDSIALNGTKAQVTRPSQDSGNATVELTATLSDNSGELGHVTYTVTVLASELSSEEAATSDTAALEIVGANNVRTNLSVPLKGAHGSHVNWDVVSGPIQLEVGVNNTTQTVRVNRPAAGTPNATATLQATVTNGTVQKTRDIILTITALPANEDEMEAYFWSFFTGEGDGAEKTSFAVSQGNDALAWNTLNNGTPVIDSHLGTQGLRDPFIIRSNEGDKFYMLATDLKVDGLSGGFDAAQRSGSLHLEIWESNDLVNWSEQRHAKVSSDYAGNTWAPEAFYVDEIGKYVVYWASNLYDTPNTTDRTAVTYNRMMYVLTEDFVTFSEPQIWIDVNQGAGKGTIDVSAAKEGDWYYRVYKDESSMTLRQEKSKDFLATHNDTTTLPGHTSDENKWSLMVTEFASGLSNGVRNNTFRQGEGPTVFKSNPGDINGYEWFVWIDQPNYHGGPNHYVPFATKKSLAETTKSDWESTAAKLSANLPQNKDGGKPRHGTVLPITRAEYQGVLEAFQPNIAVATVEALSVSTEVGQTPELPGTVKLTMHNGDVVTADVVWDELNEASLATTGEVVLRGTAQDASRMPVELIITVTGSDNPGGGDTDGNTGGNTGGQPGGNTGGNNTGGGTGNTGGDNAGGTDKPVVKQFKNTVKPRLSGIARVGSKMTADPGKWSVSGVKYSYQWLSNGKAIKGATKKSYTVTPSQVGKKLSVRVTATKAGYALVKVTSSPSKKVAKSTATVSARISKSSIQKSKSTKITVRVKAAGVSKPAGTVTVKVGKKSVKATLKATHNGKVTVTVRGKALKVAKNQKVTVLFTPNKVTGKAVVKSKVTRVGKLTVRR